MRVIYVVVALIALYATATQAADPCSPAQAPSYGNPLVNLIGQFGQQQRAQACAEERRSQWAEYNARQKAAQDKAAADAAQQKQADAEKAAASQAEAAAKQAHAAVVAEAHVRHRRERAHDDVLRQQAAEAKRRDAYLRLVRNENAPGNICHDPKMARTVMTGWNGLDTARGASVQVIDIEHMTTVYFHADDRSMSCHGVFVTRGGARVSGTATVRRNIAGDPLFLWERDADQDLSRYAAPAGLEVHVMKAAAVSSDGPPI